MFTSRTSGQNFTSRTLHKKKGEDKLLQVVRLSIIIHG